MEETPQDKGAAASPSTSPSLPVAQDKGAKTPVPSPCCPAPAQPWLCGYSQPPRHSSTWIRVSDADTQQISASPAAQPRLRPWGCPSCERSKIATAKHLHGTTPRGLESGGLLEGWF